MDFFELPPPSPEQGERGPRPDRPWLGPPENILGGPMPIRLVLARTDEVAVVVDRFSAFPMGVAFELHVRRRRSGDSEPDATERWLFDRSWRAGSGGNGIPPEVLRFGVQFPDGSKATNLETRIDAWEATEPPAGPILIERAGGGTRSSHSDQPWWMWPLPKRGPVAFVCEWPLFGVPHSRQEINAVRFVAAAQKAVELWPPELGS